MRICTTKVKVGVIFFFLLGGLMYCTALAQQTTVSGTVTNAQTGEPIPSVNILVAGTSIGTTTSADGHYSLEVASMQDTLRFSFIGYKTKTVPIDGQMEIDVKMVPEAVGMQQLVVVGYGQQQQQNVTATVGSANMENVSKVPVANVGEALIGKVSGVNIQSTGGQPGGGVHILIRGHRSLTASNEPLIVVDGMPFSGSLSAISTQNIKSINVLKDAAATAVYGSRGANGVIIVTTKSGANHPTQISYDAYFGVTQPMRTLDMMNGKQYAALKREANRVLTLDNGETIFSWKGQLPSYKEALKPNEYKNYQKGISTNWPSLVLEQGYRMNHHISVSGGSKSTQFYAALGYAREQALIPTNFFTRYTLRVNVNHQISDKFSFSVRSYLGRINKDYNTNPLNMAYDYSPLGVPYDKNGNLIFLPISDGLVSNPLFDLIEGKVLDQRRYNKFFTNIEIAYDLLDNLTYKLSFNPSITNMRRAEFTGTKTTIQRLGPPIAEKTNTHSFNYILRNQINYNTSFGKGNHELKVLLLQSIQQQYYEASNISVTELPFESQKYNNLSTATIIDGVDSDLQEWQLASFLGRISYNYKGKYLLQISGRADGSSRLAAGNKWFFFPGVSIGWRLTREPFMDGIKFLSNLKLRASYGVVGNTSIEPYQTQGPLERTTYTWGGNIPAYGYRLAHFANPNLGWEKTAMYNFGVDFGFFNNRITGSINYFVTHTSELLLNRQIPYTTGYERILQNIGETKTTGWEVTLETINFSGQDRDSFGWSTNISLSHYDEEIVQLFNKKQDDIGNGWFIGYPINVFFGYEKIGIWQKNEAEEAARYGQVPGQIRVRDQNSDGQINGKDRIILGSRQPNLVAGIVNSFSYQGVDLSITINARTGGMLKSFIHDQYNTLFGRYNNLDIDYWTPSNPTDAYPRPSQNQERPLYYRSMMLFSSDYLKIANITLGYSLPVELINTMGVENIRLYTSVENVYVFSPYEAQDPSVFGTEEGAIPNPRAFVFGINLNF